MSLPTLLLVADDLTGAADCAAYTPAVGLPAVIHLAAPDAPLPPGLHAFSTNSRALEPGSARAAQSGARLFQRLAPGAQFFKKIDSLLRGNVGAEVEALHTLLGAPAMLICPALPAQGRSVVEGHLLGAPFTARVGTVLAAQTSLMQAHVALADVNGNRANLQARMSAAAARAPLVTADAQSDEDLDALVAGWRAAVPGGLLCGSAGLASAWLRAFAVKRSNPLPLLDAIPPIGLVVVGSASAMAHAQIAAVAALPGVQVVEFTDGASSSINSGGCTLLHLARPPREPDPASAAAAAGSLAKAAQAILERSPVNHLLVAGGDTAQALLQLLGVARLDVLEAAQPGMPTCRALRADAAPFWVTLKAGNHGQPDTLTALMRRGTL